MMWCDDLKIYIHNLSNSEVVASGFVGVIELIIANALAGIACIVFGFKIHDAVRDQNWVLFRVGGFAIKKGAKFGE